MATAKKSTRKKRGASGVLPDTPAAPRLELKQPTLLHLTYQKEAGIVRCSVQQDAALAGAETLQRYGHDIDKKVEDVPADIMSALDDAFNWLAEELGVEAYQPES